MLISAGGRKKPIHRWKENLQKERKQVVARTVYGTLLRQRVGFGITSANTASFSYSV